MFLVLFFDETARVSLSVDSVVVSFPAIKVWKRRIGRTDGRRSALRPLRPARVCDERIGEFARDRATTSV